MDITLIKREKTNKKKLIELRKEGMIPVVCYGGEAKESLLFSINKNEFKKILKAEMTIIKTDGDLKGKNVVVKDIEYDAISYDPIHVDFMFVESTHEITLDIKIHPVGEAPAVKTHGGVLLTVLDEIPVKALAQNIPAHIDVDVSSLENIGDHITIEDLKLSSKLEVLLDSSSIIMSITQQQQEEENTAEIDSVEVINEKKTEEDES